LTIFVNTGVKTAVSPTSSLLRRSGNKERAILAKNRGGDEKIGGGVISGKCGRGLTTGRGRLLVYGGILFTLSAICAGLMVALIILWSSRRLANG